MAVTCSAEREVRVRYEEYYGCGVGGTLKRYLKKKTPGKWKGCARVNIDPFEIPG
jgi:hypothetical protein